MSLAYLVETYDDSRRHTLGEFRRFTPARSAARRALDSPRVTLVVVRDVDGAMVFARDRSGREWEEARPMT